MRDAIIATLIRPPRVRFADFVWTQPAAKLQPTGEAYRDRLVAERLALRSDR